MLENTGVLLVHGRVPVRLKQSSPAVVKCGICSLRAFGYQMSRCIVFCILGIIWRANRTLKHTLHCTVPELA